MRKIFSFLVASVDGYYVGAEDAFDWPVVDDDFNTFAVEQLNSIDTMVFGRRTYEVMAGFWPTAFARENDPAIAALMNDTTKIVVSRTLEDADWENTTVANSTDELAALKATPGGDVIVMGSSDLNVSLMRLGLLDEVRVMVCPVVLGDGLSLFRTATDRVPLTLTDSRTFASGNILNRYAPQLPANGN
ncbi:dihydrofolate reductase family protein [Streptodolium elevatio]